MAIEEICTAFLLSFDKIFFVIGIYYLSVVCQEYCSVGVLIRRPH